MAAGRELAPRDLAPSPYRQSWPMIASAGGRFLTIWNEDRRGFGAHVVGALSDANGKRVSPESFIIIPNLYFPTFTHLVSTGDGYALFYSPLGSRRTLMARLDVDGRVLAIREIDVPISIQRDIAWNGTHFLMLFKPPVGSGAYAQGVMFDRDGNVVRRGIPVDELLFHVDVEAVGDAFVAVTIGEGGMYSHRITAEGAVTQTRLEDRRFGFGVRPIKPVILPRGDGTTLLVLNAGDAARSELRSAILDAEGGLIGEQRLIAARDATFFTLYPLALMRGAGGYVVTLIEGVLRPQSDNRLVTMTLDENGAVVGQSEPVSLGGPLLPAAATNGTVTLTASTAMAVNSSVAQRVVDRTGRISEPEKVALMRTRQRQPVLGAGGGQFLAAWTEDSDKFAVRVASVDAFGEPLGNRFISQDAALAAEDLAWNGTEYLLVYRSGGAQLAVRVDVDGRPLDTQPLILGPTNSWDRPAAVAWAHDKWIVVWATNDKGRIAHVSFAGTVTLSSELALVAPVPDKDWTRYPAQTAIAVSGTRLIVAWIDTQLPPCLMPICASYDSAWVRRFQHNGTPSTAAVKIGDDFHRVSFANSGEEAVLIADSTRVTRAQVIDDDYNMTFRESRDFPGGLSDVAWDGDEYVLAQRRSSEWPSFIAVSRFDRQLNETAETRGTETLPADEIAAPSIAAVLSDEALVAIAEGDPQLGSRAVVYSERDMQPLPGWPPPRRRAVR